jgi:hypothetical protein
VPAFRIVEALDIIEHIGLGVVSRSVHSARSPLGLQRREEALYRCIVPDVAGTAHRRDAAVIGHQPLELLAGVQLASRLRIPDKRIGCGDRFCCLLFFVLF